MSRRRGGIGTRAAALPTLLLAALVAGCAATLDAPPAAPPVAAAAWRDHADCAAWLHRLDAEVDAAGVRDAQDTRLPGFGYLRVNRLLAALRPPADDDDAALRAWVERLRGLDRTARRVELLNLPDGRIAALAGDAVDADDGDAIDDAGDLADAGGAGVAAAGRMGSATDAGDLRRAGTASDAGGGAADAPDAASSPASRPSLLARSDACARRLLGADLADPARRQALRAAARVPDDYSVARRAAGLYPLTRIAFALGVRGYEREQRAAFARAAARAPALPGDAGAPVRYRPAPVAAPLSRDDAAALLQRAADADPLRIPEPGPAALAALLAAHAPLFEIDVRGGYDRPGALHWPGDADDATAPAVDPARPLVYAHPAWTVVDGRVLLQLVYTLWFDERPALGPGDLYAGALDGITWRVTLAPDGEPLLYDSIHPCGCYHLFFTTPRARPRPPPDRWQEWMFAPQPPLPRLHDGERPLLRIASGTHFIERVELVRDAATADGGGRHDHRAAVRYALTSYDDLRSLPRADGRRASAFGPDGIVRGSERLERGLFWPTGIASVGAMRQWGRHATAFVGRRHFDDADLIERRFVVDLGPGPDATQAAVVEP